MKNLLKKFFVLNTLALLSVSADFRDTDGNDIIYGLSGYRDHLEFIIHNRIPFAMDQDRRVFFHRGKMFDRFQDFLDIRRLHENPDTQQYGIEFHNGGQVELLSGMRFNQVDYAEEVFCMMQIRPQSHALQIMPRESGETRLLLDHPNAIFPGVDISWSDRTGMDFDGDTSQTILAVEFDVEHRTIEKIVCSKMWYEGLGQYDTTPITFDDVVTAFTGGKDVSCIQSEAEDCKGDEVYEEWYADTDYIDSPIYPIVQEEFRTVY